MKPNSFAVIITLICLMALNIKISGQITVDNVLSEIEQNNSSLAALRKNIDAEKLGNRTGLNPDNPAVEFNYLWGTPDVTGNRTDLRVTQSLDFPSAYIYRNRISELRDSQAELEYVKQRNSILLEARLICNDLIYSNALKNELKKRTDSAQLIADSYRERFNAGDAGILEFNKAQLILVNLTKDYEANEIVRNSLLAELTRMNGGSPVTLDDTHFLAEAVAEDFENWYREAEANNPLLGWVRQEVEVSRAQEKLNTALSLPKMEGGYMSEKTLGSEFRGITFGISVPLWENRNTVKYARARTLALQSAENDSRLQFYNNLKLLHGRAVALSASLRDYETKLMMFSNADLLKEALEGGEISLIEYIFELSLYYESVDNLLAMERDLNRTVAELNQYKQ
jgi:outer membrane protein TolC